MIKLYNMDCKEMLESQEFQADIEGKKICIVTDPPFNIGYHYNSYKDRMNETKYLDFLKQVLTAKNCPFVVIHYPEQLYRIAAVTGAFPERVVSWVYNSNTAKQHRDIAFFGIKPDFNKVKQPYKNPSDKRIKARIAAGKTGCKLYDWWEINQVKNVTKSAWGGGRTSMYNAFRSYEANNRDTTRRIYNNRHFYGKWNDSDSL